MISRSSTGASVSKRTHSGVAAPRRKLSSSLSPARIHDEKSAPSCCSKRIPALVAAPPPPIRSLGEGSCGVWVKAHFRSTSDNWVVIAGFTRISNPSSHRLPIMTGLESALHLPLLRPLLPAITTPMHCLGCWRRRRIDPVAEISLTRSDSSRTTTFIGIVPI
ncbi:hypothetical protein D3C84_696250 [compost metagenome]